MKPKAVGLLLCFCLLILLLLGCNLLAPKPDIEATVSAAVAATDAARASATAQVLQVAATPTKESLPPTAEPDTQQPMPATGQTVAAAGVEVFLPPGQEATGADISITLVEEEPPPPPPHSTPVGQAVDITAAVQPAGPVLITFQYDPAALPPGAREDHLYIATWTGDDWEMVPDGLVDTANHTVSASVDHFSIYSLFESAAEIAYGVVETVIGDEIGSAGYTDLPRQIRRDLDQQGIPPQDIAAVVRAQLSLTTKAASGVISLGNMVSKTAGLVIGATDGKKAVAEALAEAVVAEAGGELGSLGVILYDSYTLGTEIGTYMVDAAQVSPPALAARAAAWLLTMEMQYINANMDQGLAGLWRLNPTSASRLSVYVVYVDAEPWSGHPGWGAKGVKFYYYDDADGQWVNYHDAMTYWQMEVKVVPRVAEVPSPTRTAAPPTATHSPTDTRTPRPTPSRTPTRPAGPTMVWLEADGSGDYPDLATAVQDLHAGSTIVLGSGTFILDQPLTIDKSLSLLGQGMDRTRITSRAGGYVLRFKGSDTFVMEDLTVAHESSEPADVVQVEGGDMSFTGCRFTGAEGQGGGANLEISGGTTGSVSGCRLDEDYGVIGIAISGSATVEVRDTTIRNHTLGILVSQNAQPVIVDNTIEKSWKYGIQFEGNAGGSVSHNQISGTFAYGIHVSGSAAPTLDDNDLRGNIEGGIRYSDQAGGTARDNDCGDPEHSYGIHVRDAASPVLESNQVDRNYHYGIYIEDSGTVVVRDNYASDNRGGSGIRADGGRVTIEGNVTNGHGPGRSGIVLGGDVEGVVRNNEVAGNGHGILVMDNASVTIEDNHVYDNNSVGISIDSDRDIFVRGNECSGNAIGIEACVTARLEINGNSCHHNEKNGVRVYCAGDYHVWDNNCYANGEQDVWLWSDYY